MSNRYGFLADRRQRALLWTAVPADLADWLDYVAILALLAFSWGEGPMVLAGFALCLAAPYALVGPWLAGWIDRGDAGAAMLLANLGRAAATLLVLAAPDAPMVLAVVFLRASIDSGFTPARQAMIQRLSGASELGAVNGLHQAINQGAKVVGPALGAAMLAAMPFAAIIASNAALSLLAALACLKLLGLRGGVVTAEAGGWREGFAVFGRDRLLAATLGFAAAAFFAFFLYDSQLALLAASFGLGRDGFALSVAVSGAGGIAGALLAGRLVGAQPLRLMAGAALVSGGVTLGLAFCAMRGLVLPAWIFMAALALMGGATAAMMVPYRVVLQRRVPAGAMARAAAAGEAVITAAMLAAPVLGGVVAARWGVPVAMAAGGLAILVLAAAAAACRRPGGERRQVRFPRIWP